MFVRHGYWWMMMRLKNWYILKVSRNREIDIAADLRRTRSRNNGCPFGFTTCVPYERKYRKSFGPGRRPILKPVPVAMMPGYVLLSSGSYVDWPVVRAVQGVLGILNIDGRPAILSDADVDAIRRIRRLGRASTKQSMSAGDQVRVTDGPFAGVAAVLEAIGIHGAQITVTLFGRPTPLTLTPGAIERAA